MTKEMQPAALAADSLGTPSIRDKIKKEETLKVTHGIMGTLDTFADLSVPRTQLILSGRLQEPRRNNIPFPLAAKVLEHYGKNRMLPDQDAARSIVSEISSNENPYDALDLRKPWSGSIDGQFNDMFGHLPESLSEKQREEFQNLGREIHETQDERTTGKLFIDREREYQKQPEKYYARGLWSELLKTAGFPERTTVKLLSGNASMNASDYESFLHTAVDRTPELGGSAKSLTPEDVNEYAHIRVAEDIGDNPEKLLQDKSLSRTYEALTGEPLWDYQTTEGISKFFQDFFTNRHAYQTWHKDPQTDATAMLASFVNRVGPDRRGNYRYDSYGRGKGPREAANIFVRGEEEIEVVDDSIIEDVLQLDQYNSPLSNIVGREVSLTKFEKSALKLMFKATLVKDGKIVRRELKPAEEVITDLFAEIGLEEADSQVKFDLLAHSVSEIKGWMGAGKFLDQEHQGEEYYRQMAAIKLFTDVELWKQGVKEQGWVQKDSEHALGDIRDVAGYFKDNPVEWTYRRYAPMYEGWNPHHIDTPRPHGLLQDQPVENELEKYKSRRSHEELYQIGVKQLLEEGNAPQSPTSLAHVLTHELFPLHQILASKGVKPEEVQPVIGELIEAIPSAMSPLEKARAVSRELKAQVESDRFKLRYEAQYALDVDLSNRIMGRMIEHIGGREVETTLTQPILEVECGDSRNEARRAAIENVSDTIATIGAAGHFGVPYDAVRAVPKLTPEAITSFRDFMNQVVTIAKEYPHSEEVRKKLDANMVEQLKIEWEGFTHMMEHPYYLQRFSTAFPGAMLGLNAAALANFTMGAHAEHLAPGVHEKFRNWMEKNTAGEVDYQIDLTKVDQEKYGHLQENIAELIKKAQQSNDLEDWQHVAIAEQEAQSIVGADYIEGMLEMISLDPSKWQTENGGIKILALAGHEAHTHSNNLDSMAYQCGACGGHSGEQNANVMAKLFNNEDVRNILSERGIDIHNIYAIGGVYNTTTSTMSWNIPEEWKYDPQKTALVEELTRATASADTSGALRHEEFLTDGLKYGPISTIKKNTWWKFRGISQEEQDRRAVRNNAHVRSESPSTVQPEGGNGWSGGLVFAPRAYFRGNVADIDSTTFHVNPGTEEMVSAEAMNVFGGVYEGIREAYYEGDLNKDEAPWKAQQDWYFTGQHIWTLQSAGDPEIAGGLSRQMYNGRKIPATRPNYNFVAELATVQDRIENAPDVKQILELGYGLGTVYDPKEQKVYRYVSGAHKKFMTGEEQVGSWEEVEELHAMLDTRRESEVELSEGEIVPVRVQRQD